MIIFFYQSLIFYVFVNLTKVDANYLIFIEWPNILSSNPRHLWERKGELPLIHWFRKRSLNWGDYEETVEDGHETVYWLFCPNGSTLGPLGDSAKWLTLGLDQVMRSSPVMGSTLSECRAWDSWFCLIFSLSLCNPYSL